MRCSSVLLSLAVLGGCVDPVAGVDAAVDAGNDSGVDAGHDAGRDARVRDSAIDAGGADAGWRRLEGLPEDCVVEVAVDAESVIPAMDVVACVGHPGCRRILLPPNTYLARGPETHHRDESHRYFVFGIAIDTYNVLGGVLRDDGRVLAAWRSDLTPGVRCSIGSAAVGFGGLVLAVQERVGSGVGSAFVIRADLADVPDTASLVRTLTTEEMGPTNAPQYVESSEEVIAVNTAPSIRLLRVENDGSMREVASERYSDGAQAYLGPVIGSSILIEMIGARRIVRVSRPDLELAEPLIDPVDGEAAGPLFDGTDLVWLQLYGRRSAIHFDRVDLMTSPLADRAADIRPRLVASALPMPGPHNGVWAGGGYVAISIDAQTFAMYRLSDGLRRDLVVPPGTDLRGTSVVLDDVEVAYLANRLTDAPYIELVRYDALGFD